MAAIWVWSFGLTRMEKLAGMERRIQGAGGCGHTSHDLATEVEAAEPVPEAGSQSDDH